MAQAKLPTGVEPKTSSITIRFSVNGKRKTHTLKIPPTKRNIEVVAVRKRAELMEQYALNGRLDDEPKATVSFYLWKWLDDVKSKVAPSTHYNYRKLVMILDDEFGEFPIDKFSIGEVRDFFNRKPKITQKTVNNYLSILRMTMNMAIEDKEIEVNLFKGWSYKRKRPKSKPKPKADPFTKDEQQAFLAEMVPEIRNFYQFAIWTGLRTSEQIALTWDDVDLDEGTVNVERGIVQVTDEESETKTEGSVRKLKLLSPALEALKAQRKLVQLKSNHVFIDPAKDEPFTGDKKLRMSYFQPALKRAGVRYRKPYQCRHTFGSMMLSAGENPNWVASYMGHTDTNMLYRTYGDWMNDADPDAGNKALKIFSEETGRV